MKKLIDLFFAVCLFASLVACSKMQEGNQKTTADGQTKVLVKVNGVPITNYDMNLRLKRVVTGGGPNHEVSQNVLQTIIRDELIYQKGIQLGLDKKQEYLQKLSDLESQLRAFKRQEMLDLYRKYVKESAVVTDSEAQNYFDKNSKMIQTKFHVLQIFYKGNYPEIVKDHQDLKSGVPFEKVASRRFPSLPKDTTTAPWDLGELYWYQIPQSWQGIVERLELGQVTDIIKGEGDRFWVIKLVNKTVDPKITFTTEKGKIIDVLRQQKSEELYKSMLAEITEKAKIVYTK